MPLVPLKDWTLVSLRPVGQHSATRRAAQAVGARCVAISTQRLVFLPPDSEWQAALRASVRVFSSPAAVRAVAGHSHFLPEAGQVDVAVGLGTARALQRAGSPRPLLPATQNSEGVLAMSLWKAGGATVGWITAPGGRGLLRPGLERLGWNVRRADVYQRCPVPGLASRLAAIPTVGQVAWLISSAEAFDTLWAAAGPVRQDVYRRHGFVVSSDRLALHVQAAGCERVVQANAPQPRAMVAALVAAASRKLSS